MISQLSNIECYIQGFIQVAYFSIVFQIEIDKGAPHHGGTWGFTKFLHYKDSRLAENGFMGNSIHGK